MKFECPRGRSFELSKVSTMKKNQKIKEWGHETLR